MNITYKQIKSFNPCYDPKKIGMLEHYDDSVINFIAEFRSKVESMDDILWVLCRNYFMKDKELRLYAVWCARKVQHLMNDQRSINALDVAERFANGEATQQELDAARDAQAAARDARAAAWDACGDQDACAARGAARNAACAARDAAWDAARDTRDAAWDAAWNAQIDRLIEIFKED